MSKIELKIESLLEELASESQQEVHDTISHLTEDPALIYEIKNYFLEIDYTKIFALSGLSTEHTFIRELFFRAKERFFPPIYKHNDFREFLRKYDSKYSIKDILNKFDPSDLQKIYSIFDKTDPQFKTQLKNKFSKAFNILVIRVVYHGVSTDLSERLEDSDKYGEVFFDLEKISKNFINETNVENSKELMLQLNLCLEACEYIRGKKNSEGTSLNITFKLMKITDSVKRLIKFSHLMSDDLSLEKAPTAINLLKSSIDFEDDSHNISSLFLRYIELVFYEITEHTGEKGKDYIKNTKSGYWKMLKKGLIGGLIVGLLAIIKSIFGSSFDSFFTKGFSYGLAYSIIFLTIYFLKGVLATKQPAMTASIIAAQLDMESPSRHFMWNMSELVRFTFRTQFVAITGNFLLAIPAAATSYYALSYLGLYRLTDYKALAMSTSLNPFTSLTLFYAFITGICLALSGVFSGAVRNWFRYNKIRKRLFRFIKRNNYTKKHILAKMVSGVDKNLEGISSNIFLGFLLGFLSVAPIALGLPIDIRHVTFAAAQLGMTLSHFQFSVEPHIVYTTLFGIFLIGLINVSVSFGIKFYIVMKSRRAQFPAWRKLVSLCWMRFKKSPGSYFLP